MNPSLLTILTTVPVLKTETKRTLPEGQEDDGLDREELEYWIIRSEEVLRGKVEEKQCIES